MPTHQLAAGAHSVALGLTVPAVLVLLGLALCWLSNHRLSTWLLGLTAGLLIAGTSIGANLAHLANTTGADLLTSISTAISHAL